MRVLVTGAAGFIGTRLVHQLLADGHEVTGVDNLSLGQPRPQDTSRYTFHKLDIRNRQAIDELFANVTPAACCHLAAIHHIPTCDRDGPTAMDVNVVGTQIVLDAAANAACRQMVLASSGAVYEWVDGPLAPEKTPVGASDNYSASKLCNESQMAVWAKRTGGAAIVARLFNTIGSGDANAHLIPDLLKQLRTTNGEAVTVRVGNTSPKRDYIHADDVARALRCMTTSPGAGHSVYNVGTGREYGVLDVLRCLADAIGVRYTVERDPSKMRQFDRLHQLADASRTREVFGWEPSVPFEDAVGEIALALA